MLKWVVVEENTRPDDYIAVVLTEQQKKLQIETKRHSVFLEREKAIARAHELKEQFRVKHIRIFYNEGHSETVKNGILED